MLVGGSNTRVVVRSLFVLDLTALVHRTRKDRGMGWKDSNVPCPYPKLKIR